MCVYICLHTWLFLFQGLSQHIREQNYWCFSKCTYRNHCSVAGHSCLCYSDTPDAGHSTVWLELLSLSLLATERHSCHSPPLPNAVCTHPANMCHYVQSHSSARVMWLRVPYLSQLYIWGIEFSSLMEGCSCLSFKTLSCCSWYHRNTKEYERRLWMIIQQTNWRN